MGQQDPRRGPRPLALHVQAQTAALTTWPAGLPRSSGASPIWKPHLRRPAAELAGLVAAAGPDAFATAVAEEAGARFRAFLDGLDRYRRHPYRRRLPEPPVVWRRGTTRLLDYGLTPGAPPVLVVPSLVNRYYVLDLTARRSLVRHLAAAGLRPLVVDWDAPGAEEAGFALTDYVLRLEDMLAVAGAPAAVLGYCMGGLLALAVAARRPEVVSGLVLLATPWDFSEAEGATALAAAAPALAALIDAAGQLPAEVLQAMFVARDPLQVSGKFRALAALPARGARARDFVALEDWLNDGVAVAANVARECLFEWYGRNRPAQGGFAVAGRPVLPAQVVAPALVMVPAEDRIVPPRSALALAEALPRAEIRRIPAGHVGMVAGRNARTKVYRPLAAWLADVAAHKTPCL